MNDAHSAPTAPRHFTDADFPTEVLESAGPVLVDFWAAWCGPCRLIAPTLEALAREFAGRATVGKVNVDENPATSRRFDVRSIPTLLVFRQGVVVERTVGALPLGELRQLLERHV